MQIKKDIKKFQNFKGEGDSVTLFQESLTLQPAKPVRDKKDERTFLMNSNPDLILLNLHKTPTHFSTVHNSFSTIDLSFSSSSLSPSLTWKTHSQLCDSDNFPILISHISPQSPPHKSLPKWNLSEVDWSQFFHLTSQTKLLSTSDSIEQDIISFINFVIEAADQTILKIPAQSNNRRVHWCSSEVKIALQDRNRGFNNFHKTRNFSDLINYK